VKRNVGFGPPWDAGDPSTPPRPRHAPRRPGLLLALAGAASTCSSLALAQPSNQPAAETSPPPSIGDTAKPPTSAEPSVPDVVPPQLVAAGQSVYPIAEGTNPARVEVRIQLTVSVSGDTADITVLDAPSPAFAEEARRVAEALKFTPAQRNGKAVAARIVYLCVFAPPTAVTPEAAPSEPETPSLVAGAQPSEPPLRAPISTVTETVPAAADEPLEVTVEGRQNHVDRLRQSAEQVTVIRLEEVKKRSTDMGEVLARTPGVVLRRTGGLGSETRLSLGGLYDDAVQVFIDGVPLALSGYPTNVSLVPVNLVRHVEVYHGVVPLRLSADALGGAINIVTDTSYESRGALSYQIGSFGMHRATAAVQARNEETGFVSRLSGYFDYAKNNFEIDVEVPDERGRLSPATVRRFHDGYQAYGYVAEVGYVERPWAERLLLKAFHGRFLKEYQHNIIMTVPYGEVTYGDRSAGVQLFYEQPLSETVELETVAVVAHRSYDFADESEWVYDWFGNRVRERRVAGEIEARPRNQTIWVNGAFGRALLSWTLNENHTFRMTTSPEYSTQTGDERRQLNPEARDRLSAVADMLRVVSAVGHEWHAFPYAGNRNAKYSEDFALENVFSIKHYHYATDAEQPLAGNLFRRRDVDRTLWGVNEGLRYGLTRWFFLKGSYEYATNLPTPEQVFGDGGFVLPNVELVPETSHNANLGVLIDAKNTAAGDWLASVTAIRRDTRDQIVLLNNDRFFTYQNVLDTVLHGAQAYLDWMSPSRMLQLTAGGEYLDPRNASNSGPFAPFQGDRIPNRPNLMGNWGARLLLSDVLQKDELELFYQGRFTDGFFRGWESQGLREFKQKVDPQTSHDAGLVYQWSTASARFTAGAEVQNILDAKLFDNFGQQRPGRAYFTKVTALFF
jgi:vitamin B12 transporter